MADIAVEENQAPVAHVTIVYNGPVAPHWEMKVRYGDATMLDEFWNRVRARLLLLPKHDPQFRRNRERVNRDAERELITCDWDLGDEDAETTSTPDRRRSQKVETATESLAPESVIVEDAVVEEVIDEAVAEAVVEEIVEEAIEEAVVEEVVEEAIEEAVVEQVVEEAIEEAVVEQVVEEAIEEATD